MAESLNDIIEKIKSELVTNFNNQINTTSTSPIGQLIGIFAASDFELYELANAVKSQFNLSVVSGSNLDVLAKLFLATRQAAKEAKLSNLTITGIANQTVTTLQIKIVGTSNTYTNLNSFTFNDNGLAYSDFYADVAGRQTINQDISTLTFEVVQNNPLVTGVAVGSSSTYENGQDLETDNIYRNRLQYSSSKNGTNLVDSLAGSLLQSSDIDKVIVYEFKMSYRFNPTTAIRTPTNAFAWKGGSTEKGVLGYFEPVVKVVAKPDLNAIAQLIWNNNPTGIISGGFFADDPNKPLKELSGTAVDTFGSEHTVFFTQASSHTLKAVIEIKKANQGSQVGQDTAIINIQNTLIEYISTIQMAGIARYSEAFCKIASVNAGYYIEKFTWGADNRTSDINLLDLNGSRSYYSSTVSDIAVTVVT